MPKAWYNNVEIRYSLRPMT